MKDNKKFLNRDILLLGFIMIFLSNVFIENTDVGFVINLIAFGLIIFSFIKIVIEKLRKRKNKSVKIINTKMKNIIVNYINKMQKITLPMSIFLSAIILALSFLGIQYLKQNSIERQTEIKNMLSVSEKRKECQEIIINEKHWTNFYNGYYDIEKDKCIIKYINKDWNQEDFNKIEELKNNLIEKWMKGETTIEIVQKQIETFRKESGFSKKIEDNGKFFTKEF